MWPGPTPVFSGLNSELAWRRKLGFSAYPQPPLTRKRPWFRSMASPSVWKFRATARGGRTHNMDEKENGGKKGSLTNH